MNGTFVKSLREIREPKRVSELGGKGYSLVILTNKGFNVPKGFIITSQAFFQFLKHNNSFKTVSKLTSKITKDNFYIKSKEIKNLILRAKVPDNIISEIKDYLDRLHVPCVSIRSSAASEDSLEASFAGLYDTFLNVKTDPSVVLENVKKCWASLFNKRAVIYRIKKGIPHLEGVAVVIQKMIPAKVSGTAFTAHPDTKEANIIIIECSWGLGEVIVTGKVIPDRYIVEKKDLRIIERKLGSKKITAKLQDNGIIEVDTPEWKKDIFCLSDSLIKNLSKICLKIEKLFSCPQDIEWSIHKDKIWILQSRPITSLRACRD